MAVYPANLIDRVWEQDIVTGTGTVSLGGSAGPAGYLTFAQVLTSGLLATGQYVRYEIHDTVTFAWETGVGLFTSGSPNTLARTVPSQGSSGPNTLVNFGGNLCDVFIAANAQGLNQGVLPFVAGNWYSSPFSSLGSATMLAGVLWATPMRWRGPASPSALALNCVTAPSASISLEVGIYDGSTGIPTDLLLDAGAIAITATGQQTLTIGSPPITDVPNVFLAIGTPSTFNGGILSAGEGLNMGELGTSNAASQAPIPPTPVFTGYIGTYTGGALPASFSMASPPMNKNYAPPALWVQF